MRTYVIINSSEVDGLAFDALLETSVDTLRYSVDGTKTFVKFEGVTPSFLEGKDQYTQEEIFPILAGSEWYSFDEV
jgi:hypothetical protein